MQLPLWVDTYAHTGYQGVIRGADGVFIGRTYVGTADAVAIVAAVNSEAAMQAEIERLRKALEKIVIWSEAYPLSVFVPATPEQLTAIHQLLQDHGYSLDSIGAEAMRHVVTGVGEIARAALDAGRGEK